MLWHRRLGHISEKGLYYLNRERVFGKDIISKVDFCENCILGKQHRLSFNLSTHRAKNILEYVHADLWGPAKMQTQSGNKYFMSIIDDCYKKVWIYLLKQKSDAFIKLKQWKILVEIQQTNWLKHLELIMVLSFAIMNLMNSVRTMTF